MMWTSGHPVTWWTEAAHTFDLLADFTVDTDLLHMIHAWRVFSQCTTTAIHYTLLDL